MKKILISLGIIFGLGTGTITANASVISGSWHHGNDLHIKISGNHAKVNGINVKIKKDGYHRWKSINSNSSQPFSISYKNGHLYFHSGMDNEKLVH